MERWELKKKFKIKNHPKFTPLSSWTEMSIPLKWGMKGCKDYWHREPGEPHLRPAGCISEVSSIFFDSDWFFPWQTIALQISFYCLFPKVEKETTTKPGRKLEWNFIFPTEKCIKITTLSLIQQWPGCASCWTDQKASQQSNVITPGMSHLSIKSNEQGESQPNYKQYQNTFLFQIRQKGTSHFQCLSENQPDSLHTFPRFICDLSS